MLSGLPKIMSQSIPEPTYIKAVAPGYQRLLIKKYIVSSLNNNVSSNEDITAQTKITIVAKYFF